MNAVPDRMLALAQRFAGMSAEARQALQGKMREQGLTLEALPIPPRAAGLQVVPASYAQQRLWFIWQLEPQASAYNLTGAFRLRGPLDRAARSRPWPRYWRAMKYCAPPSAWRRGLCSK